MFGSFTLFGGSWDVYVFQKNQESYSSVVYIETPPLHVGFFSGTQKLMVKILGFFSPFPEWYCVWFHVVFVGCVETSQVAVVIKKMHFELYHILFKGRMSFK